MRKTIYDLTAKQIDLSYLQKWLQRIVEMDTPATDIDFAALKLILKIGIIRWAERKSIFYIMNPTY